MFYRGMNSFPESDKSVNGGELDSFTINYGIWATKQLDEPGLEWADPKLLMISHT